MKHVLLIVLLMIAMPFVHARENHQISPIGYWKTIDDVTGNPKAIVQIWQQPDKTLWGRILKIFPRPHHDQNELCTACKGERHNQPIVGMTIIKRLKLAKDITLQWRGGEILDPKNGKIYHSLINLTENGQKLRVRGYIGLPLFGRSQTWFRVDDPKKH